MKALNIKKHLFIGMILGLGWNLNLNGQLIQSGTLNNPYGVSQLDLGSDAKGVYIIKLINNQKTLGSLIRRITFVKHKTENKKIFI